MKLAILGAGAWGSALAIALAPRHAVSLWVWDPQQLAELKASRRSHFLPDFSVPSPVQCHSGVAAALSQAELALVVAPTQGLRQTLKEIRASAKNIPVILACKGFEPGSPHLPHQVAAQELESGVPIAILSGPSFAQEVAQGLPAALTLASSTGGFVQSAARELHSPKLRIYSSADVMGVAIGGAVKNVMAIAAGICDGLGLGHNARAALITRGLAEITRLGLKLGGKPETFMGLAGAGDLVLTCTGDLSRNRQVGMLLAAGKSLPAILAELGHVAEGVTSTREVLQLANKMKVEMPITRAVNQVLYENIPAKSALQELLSRDPKAETY